MKKVLTFFLVAAVSLSSCRKQQVGIVSPEIDPTVEYDNRSVGVSANDILSSKKYTQLRLEIACAYNHMLRDTVISNIKSFLEQYCNKPDGIIIDLHEIPMIGTLYNVNDVYDVERYYRRSYTVTNNKINTLSIFIMVTDGPYGDDKMLGIAHRNTALCLFDGKLSSLINENEQSKADVMRTVVIKHELGKLFGLVNTGTPMQEGHEDPAHTGKCNNEQCIMHYNVETTDVYGTITGGYIPYLDDNCVKDLKGNGAKL